MPACVVNHGRTVGGSHEEITIFYQLYGHGRTKLLLIPGIASTHQLWLPQVRALCGTTVPNEEEDDGAFSDTKGESSEGTKFQICALDNRGVGNSSKPTKKESYSMKVMAMDALAVLDHLGWLKVHVCGHSMGGMIASKLIAIAPKRVASACLLSVTRGGYECLPKVDRAMIALMFRFLRAQTPEKRALVDLETHYTQDYLDDEVGNVKRRALLLQGYVQNIRASGMQPKHAFDGQAHACWTHSLSKEDMHTIRNAGILVLVVHGRGDVIAQVRHGRRLARHLYPVARMLELPGGHMVPHQHRDEVNEALLDLITRSNRVDIDLSSWAGDFLVEERGREGQTAATFAALLAAMVRERWSRAWLIWVTSILVMAAAVSFFIVPHSNGVIQHWRGRA